jgi:hypothetical protein
MRPLRWKSRYLTGISETDMRISALVGILNETAGEAKKVEHCQDLNDYFEQFTRLTEDMLIQLGESPGDVVKTLEKFETELDAMLYSGLPLAARGTPACNDCCMCSLLESRAKAWLGLEFTNRAQCESEAG